MVYHYATLWVALAMWRGRWRQGMSFESQGRLRCSSVVCLLSASLPSRDLKRKPHLPRISTQIHCVDRWIGQRVYGLCMAWSLIHILGGVQTCCMRGSPAPSVWKPQGARSRRGSGKYYSVRVRAVYKEGKEVWAYGRDWRGTTIATIVIWLLPPPYFFFFCLWCIQAIKFVYPRRVLWSPCIFFFFFVLCVWRLFFCLFVCLVLYSLFLSS